MQYEMKIPAYIGNYSWIQILSNFQHSNKSKSSYITYILIIYLIKAEWSSDVTCLKTGKWTRYTSIQAHVRYYRKICRLFFNLVIHIILLYNSYVGQSHLVTDDEDSCDESILFQDDRYQTYFKFTGFVATYTSIFIPPNTWDHQLSAWYLAIQYS